MFNIFLTWLRNPDMTGLRWPGSGIQVPRLQQSAGGSSLPSSAAFEALNKLRFLDVLRIFERVFGGGAGPNFDTCV